MYTVNNPLSSFFQIGDSFFLATKGGLLTVQLFLTLFCQRSQQLRRHTVKYCEPWVIHINHSVFFTAKLERETRELGSTNRYCPQRSADQSKLPTGVKWVSSTPPPPTFTPPPIWPEPGDYPSLLPTSRWASSQTVLQYSRQTLTVDRHGCPKLSLKLGNTGFSSLANAKLLCLQSTSAAWPGGYCGEP